MLYEFVVFYLLLSAFTHPILYHTSSELQGVSNEDVITAPLFPFRLVLPYVRLPGRTVYLRLAPDTPLDPRPFETDPL